MARVSATPGKTRTLNVYRMPDLYLVDLPGYGFAHASKSEQAGLQRLLTAALTRRPLRGVVWLLDIRRDPSSDDLRFRGLMAEREIPLLAVLTKTDKLGYEQGIRRRREVGEGLELDLGKLLATSSVSGLGIAQLGEEILAAARNPQTR